MNRREFLRSGAIVAAGSATAATGVEAVTGELVEDPPRPVIPFVIEVLGSPGTFACCYPCDQISHGNQYMLSGGVLIRGERCAGTRVNMNDGAGWLEIPTGSLDSDVIGRVASIHRQDSAGWHRLADW
ncbi:hypothetical protein [Pararhodobacter zhoushanensis]|uniref:Twin-arginine translocation signal domain-containing protein n=1 Tax=Pararhodobacter zhoushanensis TaxID=2479545 RepID=A0ABT3GW51_9RHOB|nr:hypothetical protein [Pararhodobacter zhoushanensis]MCW1931734.1 hypothetical protein [Pararhodobacter zhoushanensis]